jgi:hypothetical protein
MAKICNKKLGVLTVMSVSTILIAGGIFGLINSAISDSGVAQTGTQTGATTVEAQMAPGTRIGEATDPAPETAACDFNAWVGMTSAQAETAAKATRRAYRILPPGSAMTMDYRADRINIETDSPSDDAKVTKVSCG